MTRIIIHSLFAIILFTYAEKTEKKKSKEQVYSTISEETELVHQKVEKEKRCQCFNGIGASEKDTPVLIFEFSNGNSISICGYKDPDLQTSELNILEFNVFDCKSGESYVEYGAMENCIIKTKQDTLIIQLFEYLPVGKNWKWKSTQVAEQIITIDLNEIQPSEIFPKYEPIPIDNKMQTDFLSSLKKGKGFGNNWEDDLGKLEVLSLLGNEKAWEILKNYENFTGLQTDGAIAEQWKDAVATVEWITGKE
jgi:hypothetical protein